MSHVGHVILHCASATSSVQQQYQLRTVIWRVICTELKTEPGTESALYTVIYHHHFTVIVVVLTITSEI